MKNSSQEHSLHNIISATSLIIKCSLSIILSSESRGFPDSCLDTYFQFAIIHGSWYDLERYIFLYTNMILLLHSSYKLYVKLFNHNLQWNPFIFNAKLRKQENCEWFLCNNENVYFRSYAKSLWHTDVITLFCHDLIYFYPL